MSKKRVLFICVHNSARSQMAEAFLKQEAKESVEVESAGFEPTKLNPLAVAAMDEVGLDISGNKPQSVFELFKEGRLYTEVITVCDEGAEKCPVFPGLSQRLHWPFDDPAGFEGTWEEKLEQTRRVRDEIREKIH
ncbi:MAG: arsenate reductase ArsC, partial [Desulfobacterales bacterium]